MQDEISKTGFTLSEELISQVRTFGALGYTPERICKLLGLRGNERVEFLLRMGIVGDTYCEAYKQGKALGEYNIDAELAKKAEDGDIESIKLLEARKNDRVEKDLRNELFGI